MLSELLEMLLPAGSKRRAKPLLQQGELVTGRIDAIRVVDRSDTPDDWYYGVEVAGARYGFKQWLGWKSLEEPPPPGLTGVTEAQLARRRDREM